MRNPIDITVPVGPSPQRISQPDLGLDLMVYIYPDRVHVCTGHHPYPFRGTKYHVNVDLAYSEDGLPGFVDDYAMVTIRTESYVVPTPARRSMIIKSLIELLRNGISPETYQNDRRDWTRVQVLLDWQSAYKRMAELTTEYYEVLEQIKLNELKYHEVNKEQDGH